MRSLHNCERKRQLLDLGIDESITLKWILRKWGEIVYNLCMSEDRDYCWAFVNTDLWIP
jgi:hypothetical protein